MGNLLPAWWIKKANKSSPPKATMKVYKTIKNSPFSALKSCRRHNRVTNYPDLPGSVPVSALKVLHPRKLFSSMQNQFSAMAAQVWGKGTKLMLWLQIQGLKAMLFSVSNEYGINYLPLITVAVFNPDHWCWQPWFTVRNIPLFTVVLERCNFTYATYIHCSHGL